MLAAVLCAVFGTRVVRKSETTLAVGAAGELETVFGTCSTAACCSRIEWTVDCMRTTNCGLDQHLPMFLNDEGCEFHGTAVASCADAACCHRLTQDFFPDASCRAVAGCIWYDAGGSCEPSAVGGEAARPRLSAADLLGMPKVELHVHGDGAVTPRSLCALAYENEATDLLRLSSLTASRWGSSPQGLPYDVSDDLAIVSAGREACAAMLEPWVMSQSTTSLAHFLEPFGTVAQLLALKGGVEAMVRDFFARQQANHVIYSEMRFNPGMFVTEAECAAGDFAAGACQTPAQLLRIANEAVDAVAAAEPGSGVRVKVLLSCVRSFPESHCANLLDVAQRLQRARPTHFAGVDLAGDEGSVPNARFLRVFREHAQGLPKAIHSGETGDVEDCVDVITEMGAQRIGHGYQCVSRPDIIDLIKGHGVYLEACPSSSRATSAVPASVPWAKHPILEFAAHGLKFGLATDDPGISGSTMTKEFELATREMGFSPSLVKQVSLDSAQAAFTDAEERAALAGRIADWWRAWEQQ